MDVWVACLHHELWLMWGYRYSRFQAMWGHSEEGDLCFLCYAPIIARIAYMSCKQGREKVGKKSHRTFRDRDCSETSEIAKLNRLCSFFVQHRRGTIVWVDVVGCVTVQQHWNDCKSRCVYVHACVFLSFLPLPLCVCVCKVAHWIREGDGREGVSRDSTAVQIDECSGLGWVSSMFPIGSDCTVHCTAPPYPQQASKPRESKLQQEDEK